MWVAEQKGLFRKHGIETEIIVTGQGATAGIGALLANDIQIASAGGDSLVNAALRGGETVIIAAGVNKGLNRIMVRSDIKTPAEQTFKFFSSDLRRTCSKPWTRAASMGL